MTPPKPQVIYSDNHLLTLGKPAGFLAQADETGDPDLLTWGKAFLKRKYDKPGNVYLGLVHRLDRPVSGLMVFGRTSKAAARLTRQFQEHRPLKKYLAIVRGRLDSADSWQDHILKQNGRVSLASPSHPKAKKARLSWRCLGFQDGFSLAEIQLETGRPHQIRLQFSSRGFPLLGDMRYGSKKTFDGRNLALHCFLLDIDHPVRKEPLQWRLEPPATWQHWFPAQRQALFAE